MSKGGCWSDTARHRRHRKCLFLTHMTELSSDARRKLVGVLGMLSSNHVGERDAAAQIASKIVKTAGLTWDEVIAVDAPVVPEYSHYQPPAAGWRALAMLCASCPGGLTDWERSFLDGLPQRKLLTTKQNACLNRIAEKLRAKGYHV